MLAYVARRLMQSALILVGVSLLTFALLYLLPADPARMIAGRSATPAGVAAIRHELGLDLPFWQQYASYLANLVQGDLGRSYVQRTPVATLVAARLPASLQLMAAGILVEVTLGLALGVAAAMRRDSALDRGLMVLSFTGVSTPQFVMGILLLYVFAVQLQLFPIGGYGEFRHVVLPALTLGLLGAGWYARMVRSSMLGVLQQDYLRTAHAKGLGRARILLRHAMPNAVLPVIAMIGIDIGQFLSGLVIVETVFRWPGIGQLVWQAIERVDIPVIMGVTIVAAAGIVLGNLLADLVAPFLDPRIKLR